MSTEVPIRISYFKEFGYKCLIIWASELQTQKENVLQRVLEFT